MATAKSRLGRGLSGLISGSSSSTTDPKPAPANGGTKKTAKKTPAKRVAKTPPPAVPPQPEVPSVDGFREIPISGIDPNPYQPRKTFSEEHLAELVDSIRAEGLLQPIVVRQIGDRYQLVAGERRLRACQSLNLKTIPARLIEASDASTAAISLIENLQREGLNPLEEAMGFASLMKDFDLTQESVAERVGKGRATVANALRLLQLNREIQGYLAKGLISTGHAKILLGIEADAERTQLARKAIEEGWSVRALETWVQNRRKQRVAPNGNGRAVPESEMSAIVHLEKKIASSLNTRVKLHHSPKKGRLVIEYFGNDDLQRILEKIGIRE